MNLDESTVAEEPRWPDVSHPLPPCRKKNHGARNPCYTIDQ